jgi:hypothetical protein
MSPLSGEIIMPVHASCPECGREYEMVNRLAGKLVRCKGCSKNFRVREGVEDEQPKRERIKPAPAKRPVREDDEEDIEEAEELPSSSEEPDEVDPALEEEAEQHEQHKAVWIMGGVGVSMLLCVILALAFGPKTDLPSEGKEPEQSNPEPKDNPPLRKAAWKGEPDPPTPSRVPFVTRPIELPDIPLQDILDITFTRADVGQAIVIHGFNPGQRQRKVQLDRIDLTGRLGPSTFGLCTAEGLPFGPRTLDSGSEAIKVEISPGGTRLALRQTTTPTRLDIWNLPTGQLIAGFQPFAGEAVDWFAFLDRDRLLTATRDKLVLWRMPQRIALYQFDGLRGRPALSPGRRLLALITDKGLSLHDSATGAGKSIFDLIGDGPVGFPGPAFSPDGKEIAALIQKDGSISLARWSLSTGAVLSTVPSVAQAKPLLPMTPPNLLAGLTRYDDKTGAVGEYEIEPFDFVARTSPDGRLWVAYQIKRGDRMITNLAGLDDAELRAALPPGTARAPLVRK